MKKRGALFIGLGIILILLIVAGIPRLKRHLLAVDCGNRMISVAFATRLWADDNDNHLPSDFRSMSNELNTAKILICPADSSTPRAADWSSLTSGNCTYEILTPGAMNSETNGPFFRCPIHGFVAYPDGSVFDGTRRLKKL